MSHSDPTDDVLAAIASIFDKDKTDTPLAAAHPDEQYGPEAKPHRADDAELVRETEPVKQIDGYCKAGPGPLDAIRFKWTARRDDNGEFYVDETIGAHSRAMVSGPMPEDEVIAFINDQARAANERFDRLKDDMTIRPGETMAARKAVEQAHREHVVSDDQGF